MGHRGQGREELMLRPSHDFYSTPARLRTKAKFRSDNSEFSSTRPFAGTHAGRLSLSELPIPMPEEFLQAFSWAPLTQPRTIHICHFPKWFFGGSSPLLAQGRYLRHCLSSTPRESFCNKPRSHSISIVCLNSFLNEQSKT